MPLFAGGSRDGHPKGSAGGDTAGYHSHDANSADSDGCPLAWEARAAVIADVTRGKTSPPPSRCGERRTVSFGGYLLLKAYSWIVRPLLQALVLFFPALTSRQRSIGYDEALKDAALSLNRTKKATHFGLPDGLTYKGTRPGSEDASCDPDTLRRRTTPGMSDEHVGRWPGDVTRLVEPKDLRVFPPLPAAKEESPRRISPGDTRDGLPDVCVQQTRTKGSCDPPGESDFGSSRAVWNNATRCREGEKCVSTQTLEDSARCDRTSVGTQTDIVVGDSEDKQRVIESSSPQTDVSDQCSQVFNCVSTRPPLPVVDTTQAVFADAVSSLQDHGSRQRAESVHSPGCLYLIAEGSFGVVPSLPEDEEMATTSPVNEGDGGGRIVHCVPFEDEAVFLHPAQSPDDSLGDPSMENLEGGRIPCHPQDNSGPFVTEETFPATQNTSRRQEVTHLLNASATQDEFISRSRTPYEFRQSIAAQPVGSAQHLLDTYSSDGPMASRMREGLNPEAIPGRPRSLRHEAAPDRMMPEEEPSPQLAMSGCATLQCPDATPLPMEASRPVELPPLRVHKAGDLPPWAARKPGIDLDRAAHPQYTSLSSRRATYSRDSPPVNERDPASIALAGFFHAAGESGSRCFYCGVAVDDLGPGGSIWVEHMRRQPTCAYLVGVTTPDFKAELRTRLQQENR